MINLLKHPASFNALMEYSHPSLIWRLEEKCGLTKQAARELFEDTKRFLFLCADANVPLAPPSAIDECWHHFILFTEDYARFCEQYCGGFVHHRPRHIDDPPSDGSERENTLAAAKREFSPLSKNWDFPAIGSPNCQKCARCKG